MGSARAAWAQERGVRVRSGRESTVTEAKSQGNAVLLRELGESPEGFWSGSMIF